MLVLRIYLRVGWRFVGWRWQVWRLATQKARHKESIQTRMKQTLLFIRHGQTTWNVEHRLPGQLPGILLTDLGRQQAARLSDALTILPISAIISSPLERARDTAEILAQPRGLPVRLEPDLVDIDVGPWAGQDHDKLGKDDPTWKAFVKDPTIAPAGVESFPALQERAIAAVERWRAQDIGAYPAFVAHADVIKVLVAHYTCLEVRYAGRLMIDNASVSVVEIESPEQRPRIVAIGWNPHPGWLKAPAAEEPKSEAQQAGEQKE